MEVIILDKIKIKIEDFELTTNTLLKGRVSQEYHPTTGELFPAKIYEHPKLHSKESYYQIRDHKLELEFHPHPITKDYQRVAGAEQLKQKIKHIEDDMKELGIKTNLSSGRLSRLDIAKDITTRYKYENYNTVFDEMIVPARRLKKVIVGGGAQKGTESHYYQNVLKQKKGSRAPKFTEVINFYNKSLDISLKEGSTLFDIPKNLLRCEIRLLTQRKCSSALGKKTLGY
jgi:hypothetical protein